jgi:hypothetical protein
MFKTPWSCLKAVALIAMLIGTAATQSQANEFLDERIQLRGFAHQSFLLSDTDKNKFHNTDTAGSFEYNSLALLFSFKATDDLTIWTQLFTGGETNNIRLDWAFADYRFNDWLRIRGGQIKTPLGLMNETRDIKYLHLSSIEPGIYSEEAGFMFEAFRGASALLDYEVGGGKFILDLFGGAPVFNDSLEAAEKHYALLGGRLTYETPLPGLSVGGSFLTEREETGDESGSKKIYGGSAEYKNAGLELRGEYFAMNDREVKGYGYYAEAGYTILDKIVPFVRYDHLVMDKEQKSDPAFYQKGLSFGVGYNFNKYANIRVEDHIMKGFALSQRDYSEENEEAIEAGTVPATMAGEKSWNLFAVSLNLMF